MAAGQPYISRRYYYTLGHYPGEGHKFPCANSSLSFRYFPQFDGLLHNDTGFFFIHLFFYCSHHPLNEAPMSRLYRAVHPPGHFTLELNTRLPIKAKLNIKHCARCQAEGNFGGNQLLDGSISLSPLYPNLTIDLHVRIATSLHQSFPWLHPSQE